LIKNTYTNNILNIKNLSFFLKLTSKRFNYYDSKQYKLLINIVFSFELIIDIAKQRCFNTGDTMINKAKVLIAEDEYITALDFKKIIQGIGFDVSAIVSTGEGIIEQVNKEVPNLILSDINLKGELDGIEAMARLQENFNIPFIYVTAYRDFERIVEIYNLKPIKYLIKPINSFELARIIKGCLKDK
jgi:CheY-like chemotaxis protein